MKKVTVYTTPSCGHCREVKRFLSEKGVQYEEVDVAADPAVAQGLVRRTRQYGVPVVDVDGTLVVGFDRKRLEELIRAA